jgi:Transposase
LGALGPVVAYAETGQSGVAEIAPSWSPSDVEGLNNKAKVTMRKSYGFRSYHVLDLALYHSLGKLPKPESTHDFF